jgi:hypothetical protein
MARFSVHALVNMTRPELSPLILAPLARDAGGWGSCGEGFATAEDADYQRLLAALRAAKQGRDTVPRYGTPDYRPNPQYVREMRRFGILPPDAEPGSLLLDHFEIDRRYWEALW